jgi:hypothetical protein
MDRLEDVEKVWHKIVTVDKCVPSADAYCLYIKAIRQPTHGSKILDLLKKLETKGYLFEMRIWEVRFRQNAKKAFLFFKKKEKLTNDSVTTAGNIDINGSITNVITKRINQHPQFHASDERPRSHRRQSRSPTPSS